MASQSKADELSKIINELKKERDEHVAAIERIDATFQQYGIDPENVTGGGRTTRRKKSTTARKKRGAKKKRSRTRGRFSRTGEESVLAFVKWHGSPTAREVNEHWQAEGRGGKADNTLSKLVTQGKLKRFKHQGRGSRYQAM